MNRLEEVLKLAATEPAHRPEFFQLLLESDAWVPGESTTQQLDASTPVDLQHWKKRMAAASFLFSRQKRR